MSGDRRSSGDWAKPDLSDRVACVTGASYGVGRGIAEVLGMCGATVYVVARSTRARPTKNPEWTVESTADLVNAAGGHGIPVSGDVGEERDVASLFERIAAERDGLDLMVNSAWRWGPAETYFAATEEQPVERWDAMFGTGVRALFLVAKWGLRLLALRRGLLVATQERPGDEDNFSDNVVVDAAAVSVERTVAFLARENRERGISALLVYPGWVRSVNRGMGFDLDLFGWTVEQFEAATQSTHLIGRAIAHLSRDPQAHALSGRAIYAGDLALRYGFTDIDGRVPGYDGTDLIAGSETPPDHP